MLASTEPNHKLEELLRFGLHLEHILNGDLPLATHFQPIVDLQRGIVAGYEALARFPADIGLSPDVAFGMARELGKVEALEVMATKQALAMRHFLPGNCFLSLNVSPVFLMTEGWQRLVNETADFGGVVIEVTEGSSVEDYAPLREKLMQIRLMGGSVAVDDAGAGYASLSHILQLKPEFIKLDRSFIKNCHLDRAKATLIEMMGAAANRMDAWIVAEGVELPQEMEELIALGVPLAQGYLLGKPDPELASLPEDLGSTIHQRNQGRSPTLSLHQHLRSCTTCDCVDKAEAQFDQLAETEAVVVLDQYNRPINVLEKNALLGKRMLQADFMRANISSDPATVLRRAMTRSNANRFDPIVITGEEGEFLGILRVESLTTALLEGGISTSRRMI
ncbi:MAG: EAL domain-containing protein [Terriglobus sp.]